MASSGMMKRRVTLIKPAPQFLNDVGEMESNGETTRYRVCASWKEAAGGERLTEEQEFSADTIIIEFWYNRVFADIDYSWTLEDERGDVLDIVSVTEKGGRQVQISIRAVRRT